MRALFGALLLLALGCTSKAKPPLPDTFLFGASIAGFQVDMGCPTLPNGECEDPNSDWYDFVTRRGEMSDIAQYLSTDAPDAGPGHWELYEHDYDLAKNQLGLDSVRLSIEWSRIFPSATDAANDDTAVNALADPKAVAKYHAMFAALKARGLKPLVTLNHYTLPKWLHDGVACHNDFAHCANRGWLDHDRILKEIAKYAAFCGREFGGDVDFWVTENEPFAVVLPGFLLPSADRVNPPGVQFQFAAAKQVMLAMEEAHARMYDALKAADTVDADGDGVKSFIGLVYSMTPARPKDASKMVDVTAANHLFYLYNDVFLDAVAKGDVDANLDGTKQHRDDLAGRMDYIGLNYYTRITVEGTDSASLPELSPLSNFNPLTLQVWEDYPRGIYEMSMHVHDRFGLPVIVTETGAQDPSDDGSGSSWLARYLTWTQRAVRDGADVRGFFYWTLMDNYEWNHGMDIKMGLYGIDKNDPMKHRVAKKSVATYRWITDERLVPEELQRLYPQPE
ncbi:MAG: family 1 glycosylhydrolase [Myxococcaceae bacterium]